MPPSEHGLTFSERDTGVGSEEARLRIALEAARMGSWERNLLTGEDFWSVQQEALFGLAPGVFAGTHQSFLNRVYPEDRPVIEEAARRALAGDDRYLSEYRIFMPDGSVRWMAGTGDVVRDATGRPTHMVGVTMDVTERRVAAEALRKSEERYRSLVTASAQIVWTTSADGQVVEDLPSWRAFTGQTFEQLLGRGWAAVVHPDDVEQVGEVWVRSLVAKTPHQNEFRIRRHDGQYRYVRARAVAILDESGEVREWVGTCTDVTERRQAEAAARESDQRYRRLIETANEGVWVLDVDGRTTFANAKMGDLLGFTPEEMQGRHLFDFMGEQEVAFARRNLDRRRNGINEQHEFCFRHRDGRPVWTLISTNAILDAEENYAGTLGMITDITEWRRLQEATRRSESRYRRLKECGMIGIIVRGVGGTIEEANDAFLKMLGYGREEFSGRRLNCDEITPSEYHARDECAIDELKKTGACGPIEKEYFRKDGSRVPVLIGGAQVEGEEGVAVCYVVDLTPQKQVERELLRSKEVAEAANAAKDQFLAVLSHELRTPLTPVLASVEMLGRQQNLPAEVAASLETIRRNVQMEARIIDDLLDLTRISRGKVEIRPQVTDAHASLRHALEVWQQQVEEKRLEVTLHLWAELHHVRADPARLQQICWNVIGNAVKFTPAGGSIALRSSNDTTGRLVVAVADTGIGIDAELLPRLFNAFEQGERTVTRRYGGLGLGLSISKALVEIHGGSLTAASEGTGRGATFTLALATVPPPAKGTGGTALATEPAARALRILLVEDHEDTLRVMARLLKMSGYRVSTAGSIHAALQLAGAESFDLLISDLGLPDGSGLDLMRQLKLSRPLPAIALSGFGMDEDLARSKEAGFIRHLTKPVNIDLLEQAIRSVV